MLPPELDRSGGDETRPVLEAAVRGVEDGSFCGIVVAYLSRAGRSVVHLLDTYARVERAGGRVICVGENIDTSTPTGRLTRNLFAAMAEFELDMHRARFDELRRTSVERGIWSRRQTPRGYRRDSDTRRLAPDDQAAMVLAAFRARADGATISYLAGEITMTRSETRKLLSNRVYLGELRDGPYVNRVAHPAIVANTLFDAVQHRVIENAASIRTGRSLLAGLARCGSCGSLLARTPAPRTRGRWTYACHSQATCEQHVAICGPTLDLHVTSTLGVTSRDEIAMRLATVTVSPVGRGRRVDAADRTLLALISADDATAPRERRSPASGEARATDVPQNTQGCT
jgi:DNA invertase Pin-like site-specific DNA recombinase